MFLFPPSSLYLPSALSLEPFQFDPLEYFAKAFIGLKQTKVIDKVSSCQVEEDEGHNDLFIGPPLNFNMKMLRDACSQVEDRGQIEIDGEASQGGHT